VIGERVFGGPRHMGEIVPHRPRRDLTIQGNDGTIARRHSHGVAGDRFGPRLFQRGKRLFGRQFLGGHCRAGL
jgi:hypothetical protein